ncbi:hypothetical protein ACQP1P_20265 [Dactylosporangium sp. CA-052675]|uniref:hypothetical protein n=1 Tax=Dactylosporangium sp. CA-052675 TaxID=3239927 RepID=UPI003D8E622A
MSAVRAELAKLRAARTAWIATGVLLAIHVLVQCEALGLTRDAVAAIAPDGTIELFIGERQPATRALLDQAAGSSLQMCLFLPVLGAILGGLEARRLGAALLAVPRQGRLVLAKTVAVAAWLAVVCVLVSVISVAFLWLAAGVMWSAVAPQALFLGYAVLYSLIGHAFALAGRGMLAGLLGVVAVTAVTMTQAAPRWLDALWPLSAGRNLLLDPHVDDALSSGRLVAALVVAAWAALALTVAAVVVRRRDW